MHRLECVSVLGVQLIEGANLWLVYSNFYQSAAFHMGFGLQLPEFPNRVACHWLGMLAVAVPTYRIWKSTLTSELHLEDWKSPLLPISSPLVFGASSYYWRVSEKRMMLQVVPKEGEGKHICISIFLQYVVCVIQIHTD